ncbi:MAG: dephospho-CoA kinase [Reichenbachiella sp.]|uniref:dephospho-CoA kinase n=1 Tax=Reichenbachiella sp. TaxID=2184521 RepID=UPI0032981327
MKIVGITGGIGSGKSTVCEIFKILDIPVYQADDRAKFLMQHHTGLISSITDLFGEEAYQDGKLNRPYLANAIFNDAEKTKKINGLVHPLVGEDFKTWIKSQGDAPYVLKEAALMIESGSYKQLDVMINVYTPIETRIQRVQKRDPHRSIEEIKGIIDKQVNEETRSELADFILNNDGKKLIIPQVLSIHAQLMDSSS